MRNTITVTCLLVVVAVGMSAAQTPTPQPAVKNQANIDALKKRLDEKGAEIKRTTELRDKAEASLSEPAPPSLDPGGSDVTLKPGLEGAQELFGLLFTCFGSPRDCGLNSAGGSPSSDPDALGTRLQYLEDSKKQLTKLILEYDKIHSEFVAAGGAFEGGILRFTLESQPGPLSDEQKRLEEEYRAEEIKRRQEAKNKTKNEPPAPPPPPPPISSTAHTPTWDVAASFGVESSLQPPDESATVGTSTAGHAVRNIAITGVGLATLGAIGLSRGGGAESVAVTPPVQTAVPPAPVAIAFSSLDGTYSNVTFLLQSGSCTGFNPQFTGTITVTGHSSDAATAIVRIVESITREYRGLIRNGTFEGTGNGAFASGRTWIGQLSALLGGGSVRNAREVLNVGASATSPACTTTYVQP